MVFADQLKHDYCTGFTTPGSSKDTIPLQFGLGVQAGEGLEKRQQAELVKLTTGPRKAKPMWSRLRMQNKVEFSVSIQSTPYLTSCIAAEIGRQRVFRSVPGR